MYMAKVYLVDNTSDLRKRYAEKSPALLLIVAAAAPQNGVPGFLHGFLRSSKGIAC